jgi:Zn-dependent peptidase ImmA (M78 family)/transcriptional regulator with XRE-family HTH domain
VTSVAVNPRVLIWARGERGLNEITAADKLGITLDELAALESGAATPTITTLRHIASKYEIGFSALLMPEPLPTTSQLKVSDFRTHASGLPVWTPELLAMLDELNELIEGLADLREMAPDDFRFTDMPRATSASDPVAVAAEERKRLGLKLDAQLGLKTDLETFRRFRALVEDSGVFVYVISAGSTNSWRGLSIYDDRKIPVIVINGAEKNNSGKLFTLFHEYYHILLRQSAISDQGRGSPAEANCNRFAAHFLMPASRFVEEAQIVNSGYRDWDLRDAKALATRFHLSISAVAIHLEELGLANEGYGQATINQLAASTAAKPGFVDYYDQMANKFGVRHFRAIFRALDAGIVDKIDAFELTTVQPEYFPKMRSAIAERQAAYGRSS